MYGFMFFLGVIAYLVMVHPWVFFLLIIPIAFLLLLVFVKWLKK